MQCVVLGPRAGGARKDSDIDRVRRSPQRRVGDCSLDLDQVADAVPKLADGLRKAGGDVTFIHLPEIGIFGNTHMMMIDRNNLQIARLLRDRMETHVERSSK